MGGYFRVEGAAKCTRGAHGRRIWSRRQSSERRGRQVHEVPNLPPPYPYLFQGVLRQCLDDVRAKREQLQPGGGNIRMYSGVQHPPAAVNRPRPASARLPSSGTTTSGSTCTSSPYLYGGLQGGMLSSSTRRPSSAALRTSRRPFSAAAGMPPSVVMTEREKGDDDVDEEVLFALSAAGGVPLAPGEREELVEALLRREGMLQQLFAGAFPSSSLQPPLVPGDAAAMERLLVQQEEEEREVMVAARAAGKQQLAQFGGGGGGASKQLQQSTGGGPRPAYGAAAEGGGGRQVWTPGNTDAKMADFLTGGRGGSGGAPKAGGALASWGRPLSASFKS